MKCGTAPNRGSSPRTQQLAHIAVEIRQVCRVSVGADRNPNTREFYSRFQVGEPRRAAGPVLRYSTPSADRFTSKSRPKWHPFGTSKAAFLVTRAVGPPGCASLPWRRNGASPSVSPTPVAEGGRARKPSRALSVPPHGRSQTPAKDRRHDRTISLTSATARYP
jgi:hypothetical protein